MILKNSSLALTTKVASGTDRSTEAREEKSKLGASANISSPTEQANRPITVLALSRQQLRALERAEINTIAELAALSNKELLQIHQIGPHTAAKIQTLLAAYLDKQRAEQSESSQGERARGRRERHAHRGGGEANDTRTEKGAKRQRLSPTQTEAHIMPFGCSPTRKTAPLKALYLSTRSHNTLRRAGIHTVGELASLSEEELRTIRNIGDKTLTEIKEKLANFFSETS